MKKITLFIIMAYLALPTNASAYVNKGYCSQQYTGGDASQCDQINLDACGDAAGTQTYHISSAGGCFIINRCTACKNGRVKVTNKQVEFCTNEYLYDTCECPTSCKTTNWAAGNTGYQTRTVCNTTTCTATTEYRCAVGYYGSSSNGTSGCTRCPEASAIYTNSALTTKARGTSAAGATSQSSCYLAAGTYYDASGTFSVTGTSCTY